MMEAAPAASFKMPESHLLLELLIIALDAPAQLGQIDQTVEGNLFRQRREPVFGRRVLAFGPLDQQPFFGAALGEIIIAMGGTHTNPRKARGQRLGRAFAPCDGTPGSCWQGQRPFLCPNPPAVSVAPDQFRPPAAGRPNPFTPRAPA